jgi:NNP family nitrate/nitrite transporter-like MFS transporter
MKDGGHVTVCFAAWMMLGVTGIPIRDQLGLNASEFGLLTATPVLTGSILRLPLGIWTDRFGGRIVMFVLLIASAFPLWLSSYATHLWQFLALGLALGVVGGAFAVGTPYVARLFPNHRGLAMGVFGAGVSGAAINMFVAPHLVNHFGWQSVPRTYAAVLLIVAALFWVLSLPDPGKNTATLPIRRQLAVLRDPRVWRYCQYYSIVFGGFTALSLWLPQYFLHNYHFPIAQASLMAACFALPSGLMRAFGGWLSDRFGAHNVTWWVLGGAWICLLLLSYPQTDLEIQTLGRPLSFHLGPTAWEFVAGLLILGFCFACGMASTYKSISDEFPTNMGAASGVVSMFGGLAGFLLPIMFGALIDITGIGSSCFMLLFTMVSAALILSYLTEASRVRVNGHPIEDDGERVFSLGARGKIILACSAVMACMLIFSVTVLVLGAQMGGPSREPYDKTFVSLHYAQKAQTAFVRLEAHHTDADMPLTGGSDAAAVAGMLHDLEVSAEQAMSDKERSAAVVASADLARLTDSTADAPRPTLSSIGQQLERLTQRFADDASERRQTADAAMSKLRGILLIIAAAAVVSAAAFAWFLSIGLLSATRTIAERKMLQQALVGALDDAHAALRVKSDFLANMTHELRTPLNAIVGFSEVLKQNGELNVHHVRQVNLIWDASQTLLGVVNNVLDFSKLEAGAVELDMYPFDPAQVVESTVSLLADQALAKGLTVSVSAAGLEGPLLGDGVRLCQVVLNFVSNATKFTPRGEIEVRVHQRDEGERRRLRVEVKDSGIGVPRDQIDTIFDRFTQADASISRQYGGTGLGLAISKRIIEALGGQIGVDSELGRGSTFWFEVPMLVADAANEDISERQETNAIDQKLRLLIVEDNAVNRELVCTLLSPFDLEIELACDGVDAVEAVSRSAFDLILMDVQMPNMDGLTATRRIRASASPGARRVPIIAMTANVLPEQVARCLDAGMDDHLGKPIDMKKLLETVGRWSSPEPDGKARTTVS